jgi:uncharacterized protein YjiS (DUF1127 family)
MINYTMTQTTLDRTAPRILGTFVGRPLDRLPVLVHEWRTRRNLERSLGHLSNFYLRDIGLIKADVEAACADSFDRSAFRALKSTAQNRMGNW